MSKREWPISDLKFRWRMHRWLCRILGLPACSNMPGYHEGEHNWVIGTKYADGLVLPVDSNCAWCGKPVFHIREALKGKP